MPAILKLNASETNHGRQIVLDAAPLESSAGFYQQKADPKGIGFGSIIQTRR
jgi:hypothetical protein